MARLSPRLEARERPGCQTANELGAPAVSSINMLVFGDRCSQRVNPPTVRFPVARCVRIGFSAGTAAAFSAGGTFWRELGGLSGEQPAWRATRAAHRMASAVSARMLSAGLITMHFTILRR
jgi:hypothetical protein